MLVQLLLVHVCALEAAGNSPPERKSFSMCGAPTQYGDTYAGQNVLVYRFTVVRSRPILFRYQR